MYSPFRFYYEPITNPTNYTPPPPPPPPPPFEPAMWSFSHHHLFTPSLPSKTLSPPSLRLLHARSSRRIACAAHNSQSSSSSSDLVELPIFPLPLVLFPGAILPLQIFEFRYRIMMHTLLHSDLRFGVLFSEPSLPDLSFSVGCVAEVVKHERLLDDRFFLICKGQERFRLSSFVRREPYLVASVSFLEDRPSLVEDKNGGGSLEALAEEVETLMREVIRLSNRLSGKKEKSEVQDLRRNLFPTPFSFFVGSTFDGAPREQQALLELEDTAARLNREKETLRNTLNYLTAASAVKDVFPSSSSSSSQS